MPSQSKPQARMMAAIAHGAKLDMKNPPPMAVAKEFNKADVRTGILRKKGKPKK